MSPQPPLVARVGWRPMRGYWFGLHQASLHGRILLAESAAHALDQLDQAIGAVVAPLPAGWASQRGCRGLLIRLLYWTAALQRRAGLAVSLEQGLGPASQARNGRVEVTVTIPAPHPRAAMAAFDAVATLVNAMPTEGLERPRIEAAETALRELLQAYRPAGQNTPYLMLAALEQGVPARLVAPGVLRLGWGCRQRIFASTLSDRTLAVATHLARSKVATARVLRSLGLPGAENRRVADADEACRVARQMGFPVVIKPADLDGGHGVAADLPDEPAVRKHFALAAALSPQVIVERHAPGTGYRFTLAGDKVLKLTAKRPWGVVGDGASCIEQLAAADLAARATGLRSAGLTMRLDSSVSPELDDEALDLLAQHGLGLRDVPPAGQFIALRRRNNESVGGTSQRLPLEAAHADNLALALRAVRALMLDIAGVDLIVQDIGRSWTEQPAVICDVNAQPQTDARTMETLLRDLLAGSDCRIPVWLLIMGEAANPPGDEEAAALVAALGVEGLSAAAAIWLHGRRMQTLPLDAWGAAESLLQERELKSAALMLPLSVVRSSGLPVDRLAGCIAAPDLPVLLSALGGEGEAFDARQGWRVLAPDRWPAGDIDLLHSLRAAIEPHLAPPRSA